MNITTAIIKGLTGTLRWQGRARRAEYWLFLPFGLLLPVLAMAGAQALGYGGWVSVLAGLALLMPLVAVTCRRALDSGATIAATLTPATDLLAFLAGVWLTQQLGTALLAGLQHEDGPAGFGLMILFVIVMPVMAAITFRFFLSGLLHGSALFSQMAAPSQPFANRYGANPFEVQQ